MTVKPPKKMIKVNGIMRMNPEYTKWKQMQESGGGKAPAPPEAQIAATDDATGVPMVAAAFVDENAPPQPPPKPTTGAAPGYVSPGSVPTSQLHEPGMSTIPSPHHPPPHHRPPGQKPPQYHGKYGSRPVEITCPHCHRQMRTRTEEVIGMGTIIAMMIICFFFWPLFWLPLVMPDCKQMDHYCPLCGAKVGEKPSSCCDDGCC